MVTMFNPKRAQKAAIELLVAVGILLGVTGLAHCSSGCRLPSAAEMEAAYTAELTHCSATAKTKAEAKECRKQVNTKYGLCDKKDWPYVTPCDE
jgi:hypothetical protein